jgi:hypothetical protein
MSDVVGRPWSNRLARGPVGLLWAWIRGVHKPKYWRMRCARCGFTGQVHYPSALFPCRRFVPTKGESR